MKTSALARLTRRTALAGLILWGSAAIAQQQVILGSASRTATPKSQLAEVISYEGAGVIDLGAPSAEVLKSLDPASRIDGAKQIGVERFVLASLQAAATASTRWTSAAGVLEGGLEVRSPGAVAMRVAVALRGAPAGAKVKFADAAGVVVHAADAAEVALATRDWGAYWGPVTRGADQLVQIALPAGAPVTEGMLVVKSVSHLMVDPAAPAAPLGGAKAAGSCQRDVACTSPDDAVAKAARSVAKIVYTVNGFTYSCTGTLVNSRGTSQAPYMLTAKHCIGSAAVAATVNTFWSLEAASCGGKAATGHVQLSRGATLVYAGAVSDVALIKLNEAAPASAWFSGIDASATAADEAAIALHHPLGDLKKLSSGRVIEPSSATGLMMSVAWVSGTTEPGSSGSGLFTRRDGEYVLRGTLHGGSASCGNSGSLGDAANRDKYVRLDSDAQAIEVLLKAGVEPGENYSDIWASSTEPGTGLSITHRGATNAMFVVAFNYEVAGDSMWIMLQGGGWQTATTFTAPAYRATRTGSVVSQAPIGTVTLSFASGRVTMLARLDGHPERSSQFQRHVF